MSIKKLKELLSFIGFLIAMLIPCWAAVIWEVMQGEYGVAALIMLVGVVIGIVILKDGF